MPYRSLNPDHLLERVQTLQKRIHERFPTRNLNRVCEELESLTRTAKERAKWINRPLWWLRIGVGLLIGVSAVIAIVATPYVVIVPDQPFSLADFVQVLDAASNNILLIVAAVIFLVSTERRIKQRRTLEALHELRSLAHVIDMHQLTKDPERVLGRGQNTASSPKESMTAFELTRYLNYCSEMLSMLGKVAALYVQDFDDEVAVAAVNEVEELTTGLSRKIWQKIMILHNIESDQQMRIEIARR